jgi:hypothetical protein
MNVREDIYPEIKGYEKLQELLQGLANVTFKAFAGIFSSKERVIEYINNFENAEIARMFVEIGEYYYHAKLYFCPLCFPPKQIEKCPHCNNDFEMPAYLVLIMVFSTMERLSRGLNEYVDFFDWVGKKETIDLYKTKFEIVNSDKIEDFVISLRSNWSEKYGSVTKISSFFREFMKKGEKIELVKSVKFMLKVPELPPAQIPNYQGKKAEEVEKMSKDWRQKLNEEQQIRFGTDEDVKKYVIQNRSKLTWDALPICFNKHEYWKCYSRNPYGQGLGYCRYNYFCKLGKDECFLDKCLEKTIKILYDWRSGFVHNTKIPPINETAMHGGIYKKKSIIVDLTTSELKPVFERMLKIYFDQYQKLN